MLLQKIINLLGISAPIEANTNTIMNYLKKIDDKPVPGSVVQRGVKSVNADFKGTTTMTISTVDLSRARCYVASSVVHSRVKYPDLSYAVTGYLSAANTITFEVYYNGGSSGNIYWEVIES